MGCGGAPVRSALAALTMLLATPAMAETSAEAQARKPDLFHPDTGYRIERQRAPTPDDVPGARRITAAAVAMVSGAVRIDVFGAAQSRFDELDGTWLVSEERESLPGAVWLPEVGRGTLSETMQRYFAANLARLTDANKARAVVFFCVADCWMSWNATQRATAMGYTNALWFREGTDGWLDEGLPLAPIEPVAVDVE